MTFQQFLKHFFNQNGTEMASKFFSFFFFFPRNIFVVRHGLDFVSFFLFSRGTNPWSFPPKAAIVKPVLIEVQIKTGPSNIIAFQTGERAADGAAHLLRKRLQQLLQFLFFFQAKVQQQTHKIGFASSSQHLRAIFIILVFLRLSQCGFSPVSLLSTI